MGRKHSPGCNCCCNLSLEEIPVPTSDLLGAIVSQGFNLDCCYGYLLLMAESIACSSSATTNNYDVTAVCEVDHLYSPRPVFTFAPPSEDPVGDCLPDLFVGARTTSTVVIHRDKRLAIEAKNNTFATVDFAKGMYSCDGSEPVEKIAIMVQLSYTIAKKHHLAFKTTTTRDTVSESECLEDATDVHVFGKDFECSDVDFPSPEPHTFRRIRFFDTMPTGDITFADTDIFPDNCEMEFCNVDLHEYDWFQEICYTSSNSPIEDACQEPIITAETYTRYCEALTLGHPIKIERECASGGGGYGCYYSNVSPFNELTYLPASETITINTLEGGCNACGLEEPPPFNPTGDFECESGESCPSECYFQDTDCCCEIPAGVGYTPCITPAFFWVVDDVTDYSFSKTIGSYTPQEICFRPPTTWTITLTPRS